MIHIACIHQADLVGRKQLHIAELHVLIVFPVKDIDGDGVLGKPASMLVDSDGARPVGNMHVYIIFYDLGFFQIPGVEQKGIVSTWVVYGHDPAFIVENVDIRPSLSVDVASPSVGNDDVVYRVADQSVFADAAEHNVWYPVYQQDSRRREHVVCTDS